VCACACGRRLREALLRALSDDAARRTGADGQEHPEGTSRSGRRAPRAARRRPDRASDGAAQAQAAGAWACPVCTKRCCCSLDDGSDRHCQQSHRHCKAYRYRRRRAELAARKAVGGDGLPFAAALAAPSAAARALLKDPRAVAVHQHPAAAATAGGGAPPPLPAPLVLTGHAASLTPY